VLHRHLELCLQVRPRECAPRRAHLLLSRCACVLVEAGGTQPRPFPWC
jgi:hypothetical protein